MFRAAGRTATPLVKTLLGPGTAVSRPADDPRLRLAGLSHPVEHCVDLGVIPLSRVGAKPEIHRHVSRYHHDRADRRQENLVDVVHRFLRLDHRHREQLSLRIERPHIRPARVLDAAQPPETRGAPGPQPRSPPRCRVRGASSRRVAYCPHQPHRLLRPIDVRQDDAHAPQVEYLLDRPLEVLITLFRLSRPSGSRSSFISASTRWTRSPENGECSISTKRHSRLAIAGRPASNASITLFSRTGGSCARPALGAGHTPRLTKPRASTVVRARRHRTVIDGCVACVLCMEPPLATAIRS